MESLMLSSFLTRDKWVEPGRDLFRDLVPIVRWRFGDQDGAYSAGVSRMSCACRPQPMQCLCLSLT